MCFSQSSMWLVLSYHSSLCPNSTSSKRPTLTTLDKAAPCYSLSIILFCFLHHAHGFPRDQINFCICQFVISPDRSSAPEGQDLCLTPHRLPTRSLLPGTWSVLQKWSACFSSFASTLQLTCSCLWAFVSAWIPYPCTTGFFSSFRSQSEQPLLVHPIQERSPCYFSISIPCFLPSKVLSQPEVFVFVYLLVFLCVSISKT